MKIRKSLAVLGASATLALGFGGAVAPAAQAEVPRWGGNAAYSQTNLHTGTVEQGIPRRSFGGAEMMPPAAAASLRCWNPALSGRSFAVSCSGSRYYVYTDCTNDRRYIVGPLSGAKRVRITCPAGSQAMDGGAYGY
ncbi:hypothetical protein ACFPA8_01335 [Streptomyces ovatisporus]|uniref:Secreted protein n=1 Tax=Streptomyces ovatisporus TaxID=1128682 RepID=A0ABV9A2A4_9ACTN